MKRASRSFCRTAICAVALFAGPLGSAQALAANAGAAELTGKVYFILPDLETVRFEQFDKPAFLASMKQLAPNVQVEVLNSENSVQRQTSQVQAAIANDAKAIVIVPVDPQQAAGVLALASQANVPLICQAHACNGGPAYAFLAAPFVAIGEAQGKAAAEVIDKQFDKTGKPVRMAEIFGDPKFSFYQDQLKGMAQYLDPLIRDKKLEIVCKADSLLWLPANAQAAMDQCLTKTSNAVDAVFIMNDDTGSGAYAAAQAAGLDKIQIFGGYDASLPGIQRVAAGIQLMDMTGDFFAQDKMAAELAISAMRGQPIPQNLPTKPFDNGYKGGVVEVDAPNVVVTRENMKESVVDYGFYTKEQICGKGLASGSNFCTK
jgi:D-xylose transport system substrate-binding protein